MKNNKSVEMRIYELLGVKQFRKLAFFFRDKIWILFTLKMTKEERKNFLYKTASNYNLGKIESLEDVEKFKKSLYFNAGVHLIALLKCIPSFLQAISGTFYIGSTIIISLAILINLYCIMLQRYNFIRINQVIKKMRPRYERQLNEIKEELRKEDSLIPDHSYKIIDKNKNEKIITFEQLLDDANISKLKEIRDYLSKFQMLNKLAEFYDDKNSDMVIPMKKKKKLLKMEINAN